MYNGMDNTAAALGFSDEELRRAARLVGAAMGGFCIAPEDEEYEFSTGFRTKMAALIKKQRLKTSAADALKGVTSTAAVLALCAGFWLGTDASARADFQQWIMTRYERISEYRFFENSAEHRTLPTVKFGWLPEGFAEERVDDIGGVNGHLVYLFTKDEEAIVFTCQIMQSGTKHIIFDEDAVSEKTEVNGLPADYYQSLIDGDSNVLVWIDNDNGVIYDLNACLDKETMIKIAESIKCDFG